MWAVQCSCLLCIAFCMCVIHTDHPPSYTREARPSNTDHGNEKVLQGRVVLLPSSCPDIMFALCRRPLGAAAASLVGGCASVNALCAQQGAQPDRPQMVTGEQILRLQLLGQAAQQAQGLLAEPPMALQRFGQVWRKYVREEELSSFNRARDALRMALGHASELPDNAIDDDVVASVHAAVHAAGAATEQLRAAAAQRAAHLPWHLLMGDCALEPAQGGNADAAQEDALRGKTVLLYFTASWCPPCRRFSPALVELYEAEKARGGDGLEVVMVPWDHAEGALRAYAAAHKMRWLSVPWARRELSDELSLRYDVRSVPTLIVLEMDAQGREARVVSTDGRTDVAKYAAGDGAPAWLPRAAVAGDGPTPASPSAPQVSPWRRVFG